MMIERLKGILSKLVSYDVLGGQSNLEIIHFIEHYLTDLGIYCKLVYNKEKNKASLHCRIGPEVDGGVILSGHTDVVSVSDQCWATDPFSLTEKENKLYGRGTCDMKGFLACCLYMAGEINEAPLSKPVYFAFSYDEEIGCLGAPELIDDIVNFYKECPAYAIIGEPSMLKPVVGQKGICLLETSVTGSAGHSSRIKNEVSAVHEACRLILWLESKMDQLITTGHIDQRFQPAHTSIHCGIISGGIAPNIIANHCSFQWDIRSIPVDSVDEILDDFHEYCQLTKNKLKPTFPGFEIITRKKHHAVPPLNTPPDHPIVELVKDLTGNHKPEAVSYASEAGQYVEGGIPAVICGPGSISQAHRENEYVDIRQLEGCVEMIKKLVAYLSD